MDTRPIFADLARLIRQDAIRTGKFQLASGRDSHYYLDCRRVTLSATGASIVGEAICHAIREENVTAIAGMSMGADPIIGAALCYSWPLRYQDLRGFLVRKEAKKHGTGQRVEGPVLEGDRVMIVEDVTTSGASAMDAVEAVRAVGCEVVGVVSLVDRLEGAAEFFAERGVRFRPLLTVRDLGVEPLTTPEPMMAAG